MPVLHWVPHVAGSKLRPGDFVSPDVELLKRGCSESRRQRNIDRIPAARHQNTTNTWLVVTGVKRPPLMIQVRLEPGAEVHRRRILRNADVAEVSRRIASGDVQ